MTMGTSIFDASMESAVAEERRTVVRICLEASDKRQKEGKSECWGDDRLTTRTSLLDEGRTVLMKQE